MPDQKPPETEEETYLLEDVQVPVVGLVARGAVSLGVEPGKNFFLMKSQEALMDEDEVVIEEMTDPASEFSPEETGLLKRFIGLFKGKSKKATACEMAAKTLKEAGFGIDAAKLASMMKEMDGEDDEVVEEKAKEGEMKKSDVTEAIIKAQVDSLRQEMAKSIEAQFTGEIALLRERVEKAEAEKKAEAQARRKEEYLQKSIDYRALSADRAQLATTLMEANEKMTQEGYEFLESVLKSADNMLAMAQIFSEFGTARTTEELRIDEKATAVAKSQGVSYQEALLSLPVADQLEILNGGA